jgi:adenosylhomocysteine nucleosidase
MELLGTLEAGQPLVVVAVHHEAEHLGTSYPVLVSGIGKLAAGHAVLSLLAPLAPQARPSALINLGTAGALREGLKGTQLVGAVIQHDLDVSAIIRLTGTNPSPRLLLGDGPVLATGDQFINSEAQRCALAAHADLVDMEGYAIAEAARILDIPVALIKQVSDDAGEAAVESWLDAVAGCSKILGGWLSAQEEGLPVARVQRREEHDGPPTHPR